MEQEPKNIRQKQTILEKGTPEWKEKVVEILKQGKNVSAEIAEAYYGEKDGLGQERSNRED
jgi:hypothetical protein